MSGPTASRDFLRWVIILTVNNLNFQLRMADISQSFLQSSYLHQNGRVIAIVPPYVKFNAGGNGHSRWAGMVATSHRAVEFEDRKLQIAPAMQRVERNAQYGIKRYHPLYGSRDAPLRWFITISQILRKKGFIHFRTNCCIFGLYQKVTDQDIQKNATWIANGQRERLICLVTLRVDDLLFTGTVYARDISHQCISSLSHIPVQLLTVEQNLPFIGVEI